MCKSGSIEVSPEGTVSKVNELSNKCRDSEILAYKCIVCKVHDDFMDGIKSFAIIIGIIIIVMLVTWCIPVLGPARDFFITIIQKTDLDAQIKIYSDIVQTYGIVLTLIAAFTLYKSGRVADKLNKTINDSLGLRKKHDGQAVTRGELEIIVWYSCIILKIKKVIPFRDSYHLRYYVQLLEGNAKLREKITVRLKSFIYFHSSALILYILLLFFRKTKFHQTINIIIFLLAVLFLLFSFNLTFRLVQTLREPRRKSVLTHPKEERKVMSQF